MRAIYKIVVLAGIALFISSLAYLQGAAIADNAQDSITITTYYPAPYGSYGVLQLYPRQNDPSSTDAPCSSQTGEGSMYYNSVTKSIHICQEDDSHNWSWVSVGGIGGLWDYTDSTKSDIRNMNAGNVGIGTSDAVLGSKLVVKGAGTTAGTSALNVLDGNGASLLKINDNGNIGIGNSNPQATLDIQGNSGVILPRLSSDPAGVNGMMYYNTVSNTFRFYQNGGWKDLMAGSSLPDYDSGWFSRIPPLEQWIRLTPNQNTYYSRIQVLFSAQQDPSHIRRTFMNYNWEKNDIYRPDDNAHSPFVEQQDSNTIFVVFNRGYRIDPWSHTVEGPFDGYWRILAWK